MPKKQEKFFRKTELEGDLTHSFHFGSSLFPNFYFFEKKFFQFFSNFSPINLGKNEKILQKMFSQPFSWKVSGRFCVGTERSRVGFGGELAVLDLVA